jgi:hypothetical protein
MNLEPSKFDIELQTTINTIQDLEDIDEITNVISLFFSNWKILPGAADYEKMIDAFCSEILAKIQIMVIKKFRKHVDIYE